MSELVKRLLARDPLFGNDTLYEEAADRIEELEDELSLCIGTLESRERNITDMRLAYQALEAENARLRQALEESERLAHNLNVQNVLLMQKDHP